VIEQGVLAHGHGITVDVAWRDRRRDQSSASLVPVWGRFRDEK